MVNIFVILLAALPLEKARVKIDIGNHNQVYELHELGVSIEHLKKNYAESHLTKEMIEKIKRAGFMVEILPEEKFSEAGYHSYDQMVTKLDSIVSNYANITRMVSIGTTQQGRTIWALKISDNVNQDEAEPEIRFIGIIHGDEPIGCENVLRLADTLTQSYGADSLITYLVNNREIWLIPMYNADGRENSTRYLADGEDPNRDFPVPDGRPNGGSVSGTSLETQELMAWLDTMNFVMSVTYHSGARVVNYQWDYSNSLPPFVNLIRKISIGYAIRNDSMFLDPYPLNADSGTVRGYLWYEADGTLQDWAYYATGCIDLTIELNRPKWPDASKLPELWRENRESMLWFIDQAGKGVRGIVTDHSTGNPVPCTYYVKGVSKIFHNDSIVGDFYRPLLTGNYTFVFKADGYDSLVFSNVNVKFDSTTFLNVELWPLVAVNINGTVRDTIDIPIDSAFVQIIGSNATYTDNIGNYSLSTNAGDLVFKVSKDGYATLFDTITVENDTTIDFTLTPLTGVEYTSNDSISIPDNDPSGIVDSIYVGNNYTISGLLTYVNIGHTYIDDLIVKLFSPQGTEVTLHNRSGGSDNNIIGWYDSEIPVDGPGSLDDFNGENTQGWWKLFVSDNAPSDTGSIYQWKLLIYTASGKQELIPTFKMSIKGIIIDNQISVLLFLPTFGKYNILIYDLTGRKVEEILKAKELTAGVYRFKKTIKLKDGIYFVALKRDGKVAISKKVLILGK